MDSTRESLLVRIRSRSDDDAWRQFHGLYAPLLFRYARGRGLSRADAEDVRDQCMEVIARKISTFRYDKQKGGFKNWLYRMVQRRTIDLLRRRRERIADSGDLQSLRDASPSPQEQWERHWEAEHLKHSVEQVRKEVSESNYRAFHMLLFEECTVPEVCARLVMTANQVYKAKSRVLQRVRRKLAELESDVTL